MWPNFAAVLLFMAPVLAAGIVHSVVIRQNYLSTWAIPLDGNRTWRNEPLLGRNKTVRGLLVMTGATILFTWLFFLWPTYFFSTDLVLGQSNNAMAPLSLGLIFGLGYIIGELPNSFLKRRLHVSPGRRPLGAGRWFFSFLDQADSMIGIALLLWLLYRPALASLITLTIIGTTAHFIFDFFLYVFNVKPKFKASDELEEQGIQFS